MKSSIKKIVPWLIAAFLVWFLFTNPEGAAQVVRNILALLLQAGESVVDFFEALT